jgi:hypothetical protein
MRRLAQLLAIVATLGVIGPAGGAAPAAPSSKATTGRLVTYERSGGIAGRTVRLVVSRSRRVTGRPGGRSFLLTRTEYRRLAAAIRRADLPHLPARSRPNHPVADGFVYAVSADGRTVHAETGAVPRRLAPLLSRLAHLLGRTGAG